MQLVRTDNIGQKKVYLDILTPRIGFLPNQKNPIVTQSPLKWFCAKFYPLADFLNVKLRKILSEGLFIMA